MPGGSPESPLRGPPLLLGLARFVCLAGAVAGLRCGFARDRQSAWRLGLLLIGCGRLAPIPASAALATLAVAVARSPGRDR